MNVLLVLQAAVRMEWKCEGSTLRGVRDVGEVGIVKE